MLVTLALYIFFAIIMEGTVKFYNDQKGFGFITYGDGDLFFHIRQCEEGYLPQQDDLVSFDVGEGRDGRSSATNVVLVSQGGGESQQHDMEDAA